MPSIQNAVARKTMAYVSESTGLHIGFERLRRSFLLNLSVYDAYVTGTEQDTPAHLDRLTIEIRPKPLWNGIS